MDSQIGLGVVERMWYYTFNSIEWIPNAYMLFSINFPQYYSRSPVNPFNGIESSYAIAGAVLVTCSGIHSMELKDV